MYVNDRDKTRTLQTGAGLLPKFLQALLPQLAKVTGQYGLGTPEMEELTALVSMVTATPSLNISLAVGMLMSGLKDSDLITNEEGLEDALTGAILQAMPGVRYACVIRTAGKPVKIQIYRNRDENT